MNNAYREKAEQQQEETIIKTYDLQSVTNRFLNYIKVVELLLIDLPLLISELKTANEENDSTLIDKAINRLEAHVKRIGTMNW